MANIGELSVGVKVDQGSLKTATNQVKSEFKNTGDQLENSMTNSAKKWAGGIRSAFSGLGGIIAGALSVWAIMEFWKRLLSLWSDMEEVSSKFDVVFKWSQKVKQEFQDMADATNRSNLDLMTFGSGIGNVLAPLGLAQSEVDGLSLSLTQLAIDVASFNNASDAQAIQAFTSAITGEREALKSLGIVISEADVSNKAYQLWLATQGQELTKAQKALATYQLLIENTNNAHGDAIRTSASFANQLKGLQGAIKDVFANAGRDVAQSTAGLLKKITVFTSSYGWAIIETIVETGKVIGGVIADAMWFFGDIFGVIKTGSWESTDDMNNFAFAFMKVVQGFGVGVKLIGTVIGSLVKLIGIALFGIVSYFIAMGKSVGAVWNIIKTTIVGTIKTIVDIVELGADGIGQVFVGMAEAIVWVFKGIAENVAVAVKKAVNVAIKGINGFIDLANSIPWVNLGKLAWYDDANFKPFELKVTKNINAIKGRFEQFGADIKGNYAGIGASFDEVSWNFKSATSDIVAVTEGSVADMSQSWSEFGDYVETSNKKVSDSLEEGAKKSQENAKKYDDGYYSILDLIDKYKGGVDQATEKTGKQGDVAKKTMDKVKDMYKEWEKKVDDLNKAQQKLAEDTKAYSQEIEDSLRSLNKELEKTTAEYENAIATLNAETWADIASRGVEVAKDLLDVNKDIAEINAKSITDAEDVKKRQEELVELEQKKTDLLKEQEFIVANTTEEQRKEAERRAGLSEAQKIKEDANKELADKEKAFNEEKTRLESLQKVNKFFLELKTLDQAEYDKLLADARFQAMTAEEQELVLKLAREKLQLTIQKDAIIAMQQEVHDKTVELFNGAYAIQQAGVQNLNAEYKALIGQINDAIERQKQLNALRASWGFASGGFTGAGGTNEFAGVVHKGEWVAPKWMVNSMRPLFDSLEASRTKWFASGGNTSTVNKSQTNNITVNGGADLKGFMDYAKWRL